MRRRVFVIESWNYFAANRAKKSITDVLTSLPSHNKTFSNRCQNIQNMRHSLMRSLSICQTPKDSMCISKHHIIRHFRSAKQQQYRIFRHAAVAVPVRSVPKYMMINDTLETSYILFSILQCHSRRSHTHIPNDINGEMVWVGQNAHVFHPAIVYRAREPNAATKYLAICVFQPYRNQYIRAIWDMPLVFYAQSQHKLVSHVDSGELNSVLACTKHAPNCPNGYCTESPNIIIMVASTERQKPMSTLHSHSLHVHMVCETAA